MISILEEVLKEIKPTKEEEDRIRREAQDILEKLKGLDAQIHGSFRKGTWLRGDADVDVFVFFPKELGKEYIKNEAIKILLSRLKEFETTLAYAEHPYIIIKKNGIEIDVVPALKIEKGDEAITAVDRTPFHTEYVTSHLTEQQKDEVRLLKKFMKAIGVYGAEIRVQGFSGYVAELLIIHYGNFLEVIKKASRWKPPVRIELVKTERKFDSPLIIPDPVDPKRNAAAAVSLKRLAEFSLAARYFLKNPSLNFFFSKKPENGKIKGDILITILRLKEKAIEDLLWGQIHRTMRRLKNLLRVNGYKVMDIQAYGKEDKVIIAVQLESRTIGRYYVNQGPPFYMDVEDFIEKNENIWVGEDGRLYSIKERKSRGVEEIVKSSIILNYKYDVEQYWLEKEPEEDCLKQFLVKTPTWLK